MVRRTQDQTRAASAADAQTYLAKAREYLEIAKVAADQKAFNAVGLTAVNAGTAAGDAITAARFGRVWQGEHTQAPQYLEEVGGAEGKAAARHLRRLLQLKNKTEYMPANVTPNESEAALTAAQRMVPLAARVFA